MQTHERTHELRDEAIQMMNVMAVKILTATKHKRWFINQTGNAVTVQLSFAAWWYVDTKIAMACWREDNEWWLN